MKRPHFDPAWPDLVKALYAHDMQEMWDPTLAPHVFNMYHDELSRYLKHAGPAPLHILDVGCAQGTLALLLAEAGHSVVAMDIRPQSLDYARTRYEQGDIRYVAGNLLEYETDERFDLIFANQILEHVVYPVEFLSKLRGWLRAEAAACSTTPIEFLSFEGNDFPREFDKGFGEHRLLRYAVDHSESARKFPYIAKMTGRHYLTNLSDILARVRGPIDFLCDLRDHPLYEWLRLPQHCGRHCDTRFFVFAPEFFRRNLYTLTDAHAGGAWFIERHYYDAVKPLDDGKLVRCRLPVEPHYRGTAGHWGKDYSSWRCRAKESARGTLRLLCPWFRI